MKPDWIRTLYDFATYGENRPCEALCVNDEVFIAGCFKHYPTSDHPDVWDDDWITDDPRCNDKTNGRLQGEQEVIAWRPL